MAIITTDSYSSRESTYAGILINYLRGDYGIGDYGIEINELYVKIGDAGFDGVPDVQVLKTTTLDTDILFREFLEFLTEKEMFQYNRIHLVTRDNADNDLTFELRLERN